MEGLDNLRELGNVLGIIFTHSWNQTVANQTINIPITPIAKLTDIPINNHEAHSLKKVRLKLRIQILFLPFSNECERWLHFNSLFISQFSSQILIFISIFTSNINFILG